MRTKLTISGRAGALNTAGKATFVPGDAPFSECTDGRGACAVVWRGEGRASLSPVAPTGKQNNFKLRCRIMH